MKKSLLLALGLLLTFSSKVFFCPAPANGPAQCKEAKMVEGPGK